MLHDESRRVLPKVVKAIRWQAVVPRQASSWPSLLPKPLAMCTAPQLGRQILLVLLVRIGTKGTNNVPAGCIGDAGGHFYTVYIPNYE